MKRTIPAAVFALAGGLASATQVERELPRGRIIEKVVCRAAPEQSYALFLPAGYSAERRWPILYALDARGRALIPAERFQSAASAWGWVIASSYGTRSDDDSEPSVRALRAMWDDSHERVAIDDRRLYLTGFSGMARLSVALASNARGGIAGVIGVGAGFPEGAPPTRNVPFPWFGAAGDRDFNFAEMRAVEALLESFHLPHRFRSFSGRHEWPPAEVCAEAVAWMEVLAARQGLRPREDPQLTALAAEGARAADGLAASGKALEAFRAYRDLARDFEKITDVARARARSQELERSDAVRRALREEERSLSTERAELRKSEQIVRDAVNQTPPPPAAALVRDLRIDQWKRTAASAAAADAAMAERLLANLWVQMAYYLPERFLQQKSPGRAVLVLSAAAEIRPEEPSVWIALARAQTKAGRSGEARRALEQGLARGADRGALQADPELAPLMKDVGTPGSR